MVDYDSMINSWRNINDDNKENPDDFVQFVKEKVKMQQRKMLIVNILLSSTFTMSLVVILGIWLAFPERTIYFYGSLIAMGLSMILLLLITWSGFQLKKYDPQVETKRFISGHKRKLMNRIFALKYATPAFLVLLIINFMLYFQDVLVNESIIFKIFAYSLTIFWIIGLGFAFNKNRIRAIQENEKLLIDINKWNDYEK